jgi:glyoxylase-like metal-dependent hydrolase (beta-lactamase superfamily II)
MKLNNFSLESGYARKTFLLVRRSGDSMIKRLMSGTTKRYGANFKKRFLLLIFVAAWVSAATPEYSIKAVGYQRSLNGSIGPGWDSMVWLIQGGGHTILFDSGFHRNTIPKTMPIPIKDYLRPDKALKTAGVSPEAVTDIVISHAHFDHMGGIDLFPRAVIWIQKDEYRYYTMDAWQPGGQHSGIDPQDVKELVQYNTVGRVRLIEGDNVEIFPGIRVYTGSRHTYASQYLRIDGNPPFVLASDSCPKYLNLTSHTPGGLFSEADHDANIAAQSRMIKLAGSIDRVVPGHDALQFQKFPTKGRVATIK